MPDDLPHEERAALEAAWQAFFSSPEIGVPVTFEAGWQARGAYEREQVSRLRAALQDELATLLGDITILTAGMEPEKRARYVNCERVERIRAVLGIASVPGATGESAEE